MEEHFEIYEDITALYKALSVERKERELLEQRVAKLEQMLEGKKEDARPEAPGNRERNDKLNLNRSQSYGKSVGKSRARTEPWTEDFSAEDYDYVMDELARLEREHNAAYPAPAKGTRPQSSNEHFIPKGHTTMKMSDAFPSKYLKAEDGAEEPVVTIVEAVQEDVSVRGSQKKEIKTVLYFKELDKGMVMNKVNWKTIADVLGSDDTDDWLGRKIQLCLGSALYQGEEVDALRVKRRQARRPEPQRAAAEVERSSIVPRNRPATSGAGDIDDIPF